MFTFENAVDAVATQNNRVLEHVQPESVRKELLTLNNKSAELAKTLTRQTTEFYTVLFQQFKTAAESNYKLFTNTK